MAFAALARRFVEPMEKTAEKSANILGLTPLDFSVNGTDAAIARFLEDQGYRVLSRWAMGSSPEEIARAAGAHVNLVVSATGLDAAKVLEERFGTPYVVGVPYGEEWSDALATALGLTEELGLGMQAHSEAVDGDIIVIGATAWARRPFRPLPPVRSWRCPALPTSPSAAPSAPLRLWSPCPS